jgi:uncharacterized protein (TIGR03435 family)
MPAWGNVVCGPEFTNTYDFQATMPAETTEDQARQMMQTLLADRFKLAIHWETKTMPVYALVVASGGFKLKSDYHPPPDAYHCPSGDAQCHRLGFSGSLSQLAGDLGFVAGRPVIDRTGVNGNYDYVLKWASDTATDSPLPSLSTSLRENLGLELRSQNGPVDVLVIDHAEKPTPN